MLKRKNVMTVIISLTLISAMAISAFAISSIVKEKNIFQLASENGIDIANVDDEENFKYTKFDLNKMDATKVDLSDSSSKVEIYSDPKVDIYNKMLNTIDYFNSISLTMETSMLGDEITTVEYQTNIDSGLSYQSVDEGDGVITETYSEDNNMIYVDNTARTYTENYLPTYTRADTPYMNLNKRIVTGEDGIPCYYYRRNVTNCPLASYSIVPQEITFSYLKDFDKWTIEDDAVEYLGRNCVKIVGTPSPYIATKHNIDSFTMIVDTTTGILMKYEGSLGGDISRYMTVTECSFESRVAVKQFNIDDYSTYKAETR